MICSGAMSALRLADPARNASPHTCWKRSGTKWIGCQPCATSAASSTFFGPIAAIQIGMSERKGLAVNLSGFPRPLPPLSAESGS